MILLIVVLLLSPIALSGLYLLILAVKRKPENFVTVAGSVLMLVAFWAFVVEPAFLGAQKHRREYQGGYSLPSGWTVDDGKTTADSDKVFPAESIWGILSPTQSQFMKSAGWATLFVLTGVIAIVISVSILAGLVYFGPVILTGTACGWESEDRDAKQAEESSQSIGQTENSSERS